MTVLQCFQAASRRMLAQDQSSLFTGSDAFQLKMREIFNEAAADIVQSHDWRALTNLAQLPADGATQDFALPADYGRMPVKADVHSILWFKAYDPVPDLDRWIELQQFMPASVPGYWTIYGNQMHIMPAPSADAQPKFFYITKQFVTGVGGTQTEFQADADTFMLDESLLTLAAIWRWKAAEGLDYQEDMQNYEVRLSQLTAKDKGSNVIRLGRSDPSRLGIWALGR